MQWVINPCPKVVGWVSGLDEAVACSHFSSEGWEGLGSWAITGGTLHIGAPHTEEEEEEAEAPV